ncbi:MAG: CRISPR-associated protein Csx19, partial [Bacteroidota bacterium]
DEVSLYDALASEGNRLAGAIGLFYSPSACTVGRLTKGDDGKIVVKTLQRQEKKWKLKNLHLPFIFEARVFNSVAELSWLNTPGAAGGRSVLITETGKNKSPELEAKELMTIKAYDQLQQQYAVWGEYDEDTASVPEDWTIVSTSQIGKLALPIASEGKKDFITLQAKEYLCTDKDGNAYVKYERLLNLSWESKDK